MVGCCGPVACVSPTENEGRLITLCSGTKNTWSHMKSGQYCRTYFCRQEDTWPRKRMICHMRSNRRRSAAGVRTAFYPVPLTTTRHNQGSKDVIHSGCCWKHHPFPVGACYAVQQRLHARERARFGLQVGPRPELSHSGGQDTTRRRVRDVSIPHWSYSVDTFTPRMQ